MKSQRGFTLIELVVVIIILGVLAAVAVPKFTDMSVQAREAAAKGVAGAVASGSSINYAARVSGAASAVTVASANVCNATLLNNFVGGSVRLVAGAPATDDEYRVQARTGFPTTCAAVPTPGTSPVSATCQITARGTGVQPVPVTVFCARVN